MRSIQIAERVPPLQGIHRRERGSAEAVREQCIVDRERPTVEPGVVCAQDEGDRLLDQAGDRMLVDRSREAAHEVACKADFHADIAVSKQIENQRVSRCAEAVTDALCTPNQSLKNRPRIPFAQFKIEDKRWNDLPVVGVRCAQRLPAEADVAIVLGPQVKTRTGIERTTPAAARVQGAARVHREAHLPAR